MNAKTTQNFKHYPSGSFLKDIELLEEGKVISGLWCSYQGSFVIEVPADICEIIY